MQAILRHRYLLARRASQALILSLFVCGNLYGWKMLQGNLSTSQILGKIHLADPFSVLQIAATGTIVAGQALLGALIVLAFFSLIGGRMFCSWVCPINAVTDLANLLRQKLVVAAGVTEVQVSRTARYWMIGISLLLSALLNVAAFEWISPISMLHRGAVFGMGIGWAAVLAIFLLDFAVLRHGFCGHVCPLGGFYALAGRYSLLRVRHDPERCTRCMRCIEHCPEQQVLPMVGKKAGMVLSGECTNCAKCIEVCNDDAMGFAVRFAAPEAPNNIKP
jgi:ferredoxin-type protein NapH